MSSQQTQLGHETGSGGSSDASGQNVGGVDTSKRVSAQEVQQVQNLIERCMQQYLPQAQVVSILQQQAKIEPSFSNLVWQKLEEQNPEFFRMYSMRLKLKEQIVMFNYLLEQQATMMQKLYTSWLQSLPAMMGAPPPAAAAAAASGARPPSPMPMFPFPGMMPGMGMHPGMGLPPGMMPPGMGMPPSMPPMPMPPMPGGPGPIGASSAIPIQPTMLPSQMMPAATMNRSAATAASAAGGSSVSGSVDCLMDGLDASLLDPSMLIPGGTLDELIDGLGLGSGDNGSPAGPSLADHARHQDTVARGSSGDLMDLNMLQIPKNFSFSNLGAFEFMPMDQPLDFPSFGMEDDRGEAGQSASQHQSGSKDPISIGSSTMLGTSAPAGMVQRNGSSAPQSSSAPENHGPSLLNSEAPPTPDVGLLDGMLLGGPHDDPFGSGGLLGDGRSMLGGDSPSGLHHGMGGSSGALVNLGMDVDGLGSGGRFLGHGGIMGEEGGDERMRGLGVTGRDLSFGELTGLVDFETPLEAGH